MQSPTLYFLHGFSASATTLAPLTEECRARGFSVVAPTLPGHGSTPQELAATTSGDWLAAAREDVGELLVRNESIVLIGHSFGANLAVSLAREFPSQIAALITIDMPIVFRFRRTTRIFLPLLMHAATVDPRERFLYFSKEGLFSPPGSYAKVAYHNIRDVITYVEQRSRREVRSLFSPILILQSRHDAVVHPKSAEYIAQRTRGYRELLWLPGAWHGVFDHAPAMADRITYFIHSLFDTEHQLAFTYAAPSLYPH